MTSQFPVDKLVSDAQGFQHLLDTAKVVDPSFANAMLGMVVAPGKTSLGSLLIGGIALLSAHYGFGWSDETVAFVGGGVALAVSYGLQHWQIRRYRKTLPLTVVNIPAPTPVPTAPPAAS